MKNQTGRRPAQTGNVIASNLKALRDRRDFLKKEIPKLLFSGCKPGEKGRTVQIVALTPDERKLVADYQREVKDIETTLRAFTA
jgi:predicted RNA-binding protein Jag